MNERKNEERKERRKEGRKEGGRWDECVENSVHVVIFSIVCIVRWQLVECAIFKPLLHVCIPPSCTFPCLSRDNA